MRCRFLLTMADSTHTDPEFEGPLPEETQETSASDPHAGEAVAPQEETAPEEALPEALPAVVRPEQAEEGGPLPGLVAATAAEVAAEAEAITPSADPEGEALLATMGVEDEGIEAGQLLGLVAATVVSVVALAVVLIYLFYIPFKTQVDQRAENVEDYPELDAIQAAGEAKISDYGRDGDVYTLPIEQAMGLVAAEYEAAGNYNAATSELPTTNAEWNTLPVVRGPGRAVAAPSMAQETPAEAAEDAPLTLGEVEDAGVNEPFVDAEE
ncbi:MAG: hypothetical protein AAF845_04300 [Bacteroidota bacterium]